MTIRNIQPWRRLNEALQALLILGIPFVTIDGESVLRFDLPSLTLHFFGVAIWMEEFFLVLVAVIFVTSFFLLATLLFGRIWCGWLCPQTVIADLTRWVDRGRVKGVTYRFFAYAGTFLVSIVVAANLVWYFVSPYEFLRLLFIGELGPVTRGFWIVLTVILFLNFAFVRHTFCATVCPYAKLQGALFDDRTLVIAADPQRKEECINCMACVRTCPVAVDIRAGLNAACITCAECVDVCTAVMGKRNRKGLIGYAFGHPGERQPLLRQNVVITGLVTTASLVLLLYLSLTRSPIEMTVLPNHGFSPRLTNDGRSVNSYILSLRNKGKGSLSLSFRAVGSITELTVTPDGILIGEGESKKVTVFVTTRDTGARGPSSGITISVESAGNGRMKVSKKTTFISPGAS